jgi:ABC-type phosphonate transport system ATPase subunit
MHSIEVQSLSKSYGDLEAVRDLSFTLEAGDILGVIGPNGAGKIGSDTSRRRRDSTAISLPLTRSSAWPR